MIEARPDEDVRTIEATVMEAAPMEVAATVEMTAAVEMAATETNLRRAVSGDALDRRRRP